MNLSVEMRTSASGTAAEKMDDGVSIPGRPPRRRRGRGTPVPEFAATPRRRSGPLLLFGAFCAGMSFAVVSAAAAGTHAAAAAVGEQHLRDLARNTRLLFWSHYDCVLDAAAQLMGPLDWELRVGGGGVPPSSDGAGQVVFDLSAGDAGVFVDASCGRENNKNAAGDGEISAATDPRIRRGELQDVAGHNMTAAAATTTTSPASAAAARRKTERNRTLEGSISTAAAAVAAAAASLVPAGGAVDTGAASPPAATSSESTKTAGNRGDGGGGSDRFLFSLFQKGDGSDADPDGIPQRYMAMQLDNRENAKKALELTLEWREENDIDRILQTPQTNFDKCKDVYPNYFLGRDKQDHVVFIQRPALLNLKKARANGIAKEELLLHYVFLNEYLWQIMEGHKPLGKMISVLDLTGLNLGILRQREIISFVKVFVSTMDSHYPQRAAKTLILNAPKWFQTLYRIISPLLRESTKSKIEIFARGKQQDEALVRYLGHDIASSLPQSFWTDGSEYHGARKRKSVGDDGEDVSGGSNGGQDEPPPTARRWKRFRYSGSADANGSADVNSAKGETDDDDDDGTSTGGGDGGTPSAAAADAEPQDQSEKIDSPMERELREFVLARIQEAGQEMQAVV